jgi:uncharacterized membrane-anchored protein
MENKETLEEAADKYVDCFEFGIAHPRRVAKNAFINGAKWQQEQDKKLYSEEEVNNLLYRFLEHIGEKQKRTILNVVPNEWFEQFKKK